MNEVPPRKKAAAFLRAVSAAVLLLGLSPLLAASLIIIFVLLRYRDNKPPVTFDLGRGRAKKPGVKTMSEVMELLEDIPFGRSLPRPLGTLALVVMDFLPMALNTSSTTSGILYPYPRVFEPVMIESDDGTPVCGLLALQQGGDARPALILAHGLFGTKNTGSMLWLALRVFFDWGFHVFVMDMRGFGDSSRFSDAPVSFGYRESEDILAVADYLDSLENVSTVGALGVSMGAASALLAAGRCRLDRPLAGGVVAVNGYGDAERELEYISTPRTGSFEGAVNRAFFRLMLLLKTLLGGPRPLRDLREYVRQVASQYYEVGESELYRGASARELAGEIEVPCLLIHSLDDRIVPVDEAYDFLAAAAENPMVGSLVVPGGGHGLYLITNRRWLLRTLETFFFYWGEFRPGPDPSYPGSSNIGMFWNPEN